MNFMMENCSHWKHYKALGCLGIGQQLVVTTRAPLKMR